ncbi:LysR family transcriptional regulator, partial [Nocardia brasiliensis]|uniref:LysR family transcriptional regulator n=1 Tax=Nocardia brasiliensis TaxID=37326 RepID=UPI002458C54C
MEALDMNLLVALDALLETNSVTRAAERLHTSPPAMSRTLARLRRVLGDPLLVRAGRTLVPTPRALELRYEVATLVAQGRALLTTQAAIDPSGLKRSFAIQAEDAVLADLTAPLLTAVRAQAPGVTLRFLPETREGTAALRDGRVDIEVGVIEHADPATTVRRVLGDRMVRNAAPGPVRRPLPSIAVSGQTLSAPRRISGTAPDPRAPARGYGRFEEGAM